MGHPEKGWDARYLITEARRKEQNLTADFADDRGPKNNCELFLPPSGVTIPQHLTN